MGDLVRLDVSGLVPPVVSELGRKAERKFVEFFTAHLRNDHTRRAYARAAAQLSEWLATNGMSLAELEPPEAAAYIKTLEIEGKAPTTIKARLSALSNLCDYLASSGGTRSRWCGGLGCPCARGRLLSSSPRWCGRYSTRSRPTTW